MNTYENYEIPKICKHEWKKLTNPHFKYFLAYGLGDPQFQTYDGLSYTFNGLGNYVLTRALDGSFEAQIQTSLFKNINNPSVVATFITSFAMKTSVSPVIEIKLIDYYSLTPYQSTSSF